MVYFSRKLKNASPIDIPTGVSSRTPNTIPILSPTANAIPGPSEIKIPSNSSNPVGEPIISPSSSPILGFVGETIYLSKIHNLSSCTIIHPIPSSEIL